MFLKEYRQIERKKVLLLISFLNTHSYLPVGHGTTSLITHTGTPTSGPALTGSVLLSHHSSCCAPSFTEAGVAGAPCDLLLELRTDLNQWFVSHLTGVEYFCDFLENLKYPAVSLGVCSGVPGHVGA